MEKLDYFHVFSAQGSMKVKLFAANQSEKKRNHRQIIDNQENSHASTELTLSCWFPSMIKKPRTTRISSSSFLHSSIVVSTRPAKEEVSTKLKLFDETWVADHDAEPDGVSKESSELKTLARDTANERVYSPEEERKMRLKHLVWTKLVLYDPWKIKKRLTGSDLGNHCRLDIVEKIRGEGAEFCFWDCDTNTELNLVLKYWHTSKSYVFNKGWPNNFVKRRNLVEGDLIGIYWDSTKKIFNFAVLERASKVYP
ncbi:putative B3 domain-containing protein At1g78640 [Manihot esculenta]|uniref:putative B3 domain-containing protein At1g78640 n=1 Tax=Manihot esculenta TaxID=3983 RepID=UPI000B5D54BD|nr:putative B3 domain-containing protein At1g78640 [Manihot esculenta]